MMVDGLLLKLLVGELQVIIKVKVRAKYTKGWVEG